MNIKYSYLWFLALGLLSCHGLEGSKSFADKAALLHHINNMDNGLAQHRQSANGIDYRLRYQPTLLLPGANGESLGNQFYFVLNLSFRDKELLGLLPHEAYANLVNLFSFGMEKMVHFICDNKRSEEALMVFYQPTYNLSNANSLLVVGDKKWLEEGTLLQVQVDDFGLNTGRQQFDFAIDKLLDADRFQLIDKNN